MTDLIVLGPMLRYVSEDTATIWVEVSEPGIVAVEVDNRVVTARTFGAHGHHYALVIIEGLKPGEAYPYSVRLNEAPGWPLADSPFPPSVIRTMTPERDFRMAFGSCRTSAPHDARGNKSNGIDALRSFAHEMMREGSAERMPSLVLLLGDQVYADETTEQMQEFIKARRGLEEPPGEELKDYIEYAHLYKLAYSEPSVRWLLSTLPSAMIFDDHDVRDDWNTSLAWHEEMNKKPWWHDRIVGALGSYWVYQHCGNLSPQQLAEDEIWQLIVNHDGAGEIDLTHVVDTFGERVDKDPLTYRFSYVRTIGGTKLIVIDSRAARDLRPGHRAMLDADELAWLNNEIQGDIEHLFIGTSLPFFLPEGIHMLEAIDEAAAEGAWGPGFKWAGEKLRQAVDLEHWAAFSDTFFKVTAMVMETARGERGAAPASITFFSGDIHNSFLSEVQDAEGAHSRIIQAVCSPIRNPLPVQARVLQSLLGRGLVWPMRKIADVAPGVRTPSLEWRTTHGPWFDNNLAMVTTHGQSLEFTWETGEIIDDDYEHPRTRIVADIVVSPEEGSRRMDERRSVARKAVRVAARATGVVKK